MSETSENKSSGDCQEFSKCFQILHLMLDNEASTEEESYFNAHIENCMFCFEQYEVEKHIRELLKTRVADLPVPSDLAQMIRSRIFHTA